MVFFKKNDEIKIKVMKNSRVYVSLLSSDEYVIGCIMLYKSLKKV